MGLRERGREREGEREREIERERERKVFSRLCFHIHKSGRGRKWLGRNVGRMTGGDGEGEREKSFFSTLFPHSQVRQGKEMAGEKPGENCVGGRRMKIRTHTH